MKKAIFTLFIVTIASVTWAQRNTDALDRGLVAMKNGSKIFCSWRILAEEYYDVTYNIYRNGTKINTEPLAVSNYTDSQGTVSDAYSVSAVVRGVEQEKCEEVTPWSDFYKEIKMDHGSLTSTYVPNDACCADVDGDGEIEILLKFDNSSDGNSGYMPQGYNGEYAIIEVYKLDGTKLWWIDLGPNMGDFQNNENNIVAFDWDEDGKAEAILRAADGTVVHKADGSIYTVGDASKNYRSSSGQSGQWFIHEGDEFLLYLNGETGEVYQCIEYPLKRLESGETDLSAAWGDGYGHRSTKHFFGAPYLDGRKPSIFLARGIYTRHKMIAYDVDSNHNLTVRWTWNCNNSSSSWYGQGFHNFGVADVDWDGRDEIVYGSMVIDDNGKGLSTTGIGHGDAQHCGDFDPYRHGQEIFTCQEENPNNCFRDATTAKILYRSIGSSDDGRCIMDNFCNDVPGSQGCSARDNLRSSVTYEYVEGSYDVAQNFRIYWDGDLCSETFNYTNGENTAGCIWSGRNGKIETLTGSLTNNSTKGTPCYQGDILGDWREEVIMRTESGNIRIYSTYTETQWRNYTLWHDHQYRNAMVWQMCGYNQPPHTSYFLGELEGITKAPAPLTMTGRTEISNNGTINSTYNDKHIIMCETNDMTVNVSSGEVQPYILTVNAPSWVQGNDDNDKISYTTYTHTITGGAFSGDMTLVKQGDGALVLPNVTQTYTGLTNVWAGSVNFDGTMQSSRVWLNRFAELNSNGGVFKNGIEMEYAAVLRPGGENNKGTVTVDSLILNYGATVEFDLYGADCSADQINITTLKVDKKDWTNGPEYLTPVFKVVAHPSEDGGKLAPGKYLIGTVTNVVGNFDDIVLEKISGTKATLSLEEDGKMYITIAELRSNGAITWNGSDGNNSWDLADTQNFIYNETGQSDFYVDNDTVYFTDEAGTGKVTILEDITPASVIFNNDSLDYTISGSSIYGETSLIKNGDGDVTIENTNTFTGGTTINGGSLSVSVLANDQGNESGALGTEESSITINNNATLNVLSTIYTNQSIIVGEGGATFNVASGATFSPDVKITSSSTKENLYKTGAGTLHFGAFGNTIGAVYLNEGTITTSAGSGTGTSNMAVSKFVFNGSKVTLNYDNSTGTYNNDYSNFEVSEGATGYLYMDGRAYYYGSISGAGTLYVYGRYVRNYLAGDCSGFTGTLHIGNDGDAVYLASGFKMSSDVNLIVDNGATLDNQGLALTLRNFGGSGTFGGSGAYTIGLDNEDLSFSTQFSSPVIKEGSGTWEITSSKSQSGISSIALNGGTLNINTYNSTSSCVGGTITAASGTEIVGTGTVSGIILKSGSTLTPGNVTTEDKTGFISATGSFNANSGSTINLNIKSNRKSNYGRTYIVADYLTINGTVKVTLSSEYTPAAGDSIVIWEASRSFLGSPTLELPELTGTLEWDTSDVKAKTGVLRIIDTEGISSIDNNRSSHCRLYTLSGLLAAEFDAKPSEVNSLARKCGLSIGTYILRMTDGKTTKTIKTIIK